MERAQELLVLDDRAKEARLRQIQAVEDAYAQSVRDARKAWERELDELQIQAQHRAAVAELELRQKAEEETMKHAEFGAAQRMWELDEQTARDAAVRRVHAAVAAKHAMTDAEARARESVVSETEEMIRARREKEARRRAQQSLAEQEAATTAEALAATAALELDGAARQHAAGAQTRLRLAQELAEVEAAERRSRWRSRE